MIAPCKNCPYRAIGCHSYCEPYKKYAVHLKRVNERIKSEREADGVVIEGSRRRAKSKRPQK